MATLGITPREMEVVLLGAEGRTDKEIARDLGISHATVTTHWVRMREKLGARSRGHVIAQAMSVIYREAREEIDQKNELFAILVQALEDYAVFLLDRDRKVKSWNPGVRRVLGYDEEDWLRQSADIIFTPEDREKGAPAIEQATAESKGRAADNRWHMRRDGSRFWSMGVLVPIRDSKGNTLCYSKLLHDQTRIKRLEAKIRELGGDPQQL
jgi:two-component system CheB/CheR fusion protein